MNLTDEVKKYFRTAAGLVILNAEQHIFAAQKHFENSDFNLCCFLSMTALEELGKVFTCRVYSSVIIGSEQEVNVDAIMKLFRDHNEKAIQTAFDNFYINTYADRLHGKDSRSGMTRTSAIVILARSKRWMKIRNSCLYCDFDVDSKQTSTPKSSISQEYAYYFLAMAMTALSESSIGLIPVKDGEVPYWTNRERMTKDFVDKWSNTINLEGLDLFEFPEKDGNR